MCGRYSITTNFEAFRRIFGTAGGGNWWRPRYNVAPTQLAPVVRIRDGQRELIELRWGLILFWAKDVKVGFKMINGRAETVAMAPAFRGRQETALHDRHGRGTRLAHISRRRSGRCPLREHRGCRRGSSSGNGQRKVRCTS